jgi:hypothetical protein
MGYEALPLFPHPALREASVPQRPPPLLNRLLSFSPVCWEKVNNMFGNGERYSGDVNRYRYAPGQAWGSLNRRSSRRSTLSRAGTPLARLPFGAPHVNALGVASARAPSGLPLNLLPAQH